MNVPAADPGAQCLQLPDGRQLGYAGYGPADGHPVFYFHGVPGSRYEFALLRAAAESLGLRVLALDRPGYGLSTWQPDRRLTQWPADVAAFADALGIATFSVIGVSGGGPCALACAALIPQRVASAAVVCGLGPLDPPSMRQGMSPNARLAFYLADVSPAALAAVFGVPLKLLSHAVPQLAIRALGTIVGSADRRVLWQPQVLKPLSRNLQEAFRQGYRGALQDVMIYRAPWGFELQDMRLPVHFWHGDADRVVPLLHSRYLHGKLPSSRLTVVPGEGHFSLPVRHGRRILKNLLEDARSPDP